MQLYIYIYMHLSDDDENDLRNCKKCFYLIDAQFLFKTWIQFFY